MNLAGREAYWIRGDPLPVPWPQNVSQASFAFVPRLDSGGVLLAWNAGSYGPGWAVSPDRSQIVFGSPFDYGIASDTLSLDELTKIALSVPFITDPSLTP